MALGQILRRGWPVGFAVAGSCCGLVACGGGGGGGSTATTGTGTTIPTITTKAQLGQAFFSDTTLSNPVGMSCATCHNPSQHFVDTRPGSPTSQGAVAGRFNFRNSPSIQYMLFSPNFNLGNGQAGQAAGGQFWDGHATNFTDQIHFPLLNPVEMNNSTTAAIVAKVQAGPYAKALKTLYGATIFSNSTSAFNAVADSIATFERSSPFAPFTSKYDAFLKGTAQLSAAEARGLAAFNGKAGCSGCHTSSPAPDGTPALFTNFCYANIGLPKNKNNPYYEASAQFNPLGSAFVDHGLMITTGRAEDDGNFMTPSLRNVAVTGPYFHNGIYNNLTDVVNFYNTRDLGSFGAAEVPATMDTTELGNLKLTPQDVSDIVAFLGTLTDGYKPTNP